MHNILIVASTAAVEHASNPGLLEALGIDWKLLVEQAIAFLILVAVLGKFVYPPLTKAIDNRRAQIEASLKEAQESHRALEKAEASVADMLQKARTEADEIIARSHQESTAMVAEAEDKAKQRAEQIVKDARTQLDAEVSKARQALKAETISLVAAATEQIIDEKIDQKKDAGLIKNALSQERA